MQQERFSGRILSFFMGALFFTLALLPTARAFAGPIDPTSTFSQFVYSTDCEQLEVGKDTNSFTHTDNNFYPKYEMDEKYRNILFGLHANSNEYKSLLNRFSMNWRGSCFGMATTMTLCKYARYWPMAEHDGLCADDMQPGAKLFSEITPPRNNRNALNWINFYQASHCISAALRDATTRTRMIRWKNNVTGQRYMAFDQNIGAFVNIVKVSVDAGLPFALSYGYDDKAHAVVGCDYYYFQSTPTSGYFYIKCYDENDLGYQRRFNTKPHFCYIKLKFTYDASRNTYTYTAPYKDTDGNHICYIYYYDYLKKKHLPKKKIIAITFYDVNQIYVNLSDELTASGLKTASNDQITGLTSGGMYGLNSNASAVLTIDKVNETWEKYRIKPFAYNGDDKDNVLYTESYGKLYRAEIGDPIANDDEPPEPVEETQTDGYNAAAIFTEPDDDSDFMPPVPVDSLDEREEYAYISEYEHIDNVDSEEDGIDLAMQLTDSGNVSGVDRPFDGYDLVLSDGTLPGASLAKRNKYAWVSGEHIEYVRFSSDGRLRDVVASEGGGRDLELFFGAKDEMDSLLDMFQMHINSFDFLQVYDTEDDQRFEDCIVLLTDGLADGFEFSFYKGALVSDEYTGEIEPAASGNGNIWIKIKAFQDQENGGIGVKAWAVDDPDDGYIPDFPESTLVFSRTLHKRPSVYLGGGESYTAPSGDVSRNEYRSKGGAKAKVLGDGSLEYEIDAPFKKLTGAMLDNMLLEKGKHYDGKPGSTIITLKPEFLATLKDGEHTLIVYFTDGRFTDSFTTPLSSSQTVTAAPEVPATGGAPLWTLPLMLAGAYPIIVSAQKGRKAYLTQGKEKKDA